MKKTKDLDFRKLLGTVIGIAVFTGCVLYFTYAWYQWRSENTNVVMTIQEAAMECVLGPDVNVYNIGPVLNIEDGVKVEFSIKNAVSSVTTTSLTLNIESISATLLVESFKYVLVQDTNGGTDYNYSSPVVQGNFSTFNVGANTISASVSIEAEKTYSYQFIVYIDGSMPNNENMMENSMVAALEVGSCGVVTKDANPNAPNLDNNNLIPVYYDNTNEVWKKADSTNANNSWYDYDNKMWANAVLVNNSASTTVVDLSGNGNHGVISGATSTSEGLSFDGTDDYIKIPDNTNVSFPATYSVKFKTNSTNNQIIFGDTTTGAALGLYDSNSKFIISLKNDIVGLGTKVFDCSGFTLNTFYTVDIVYQSFDEITLYLNGTALTQLEDLDHWLWGDDESYIGKREPFETYGGVFFSGVIEKFMIYDDELTSSEISHNLSVTNSEINDNGIVGDNLKLYYKFNSTSIVDLSNNYNHGTISGATSTSEGLSFDGTDDYVRIPDNTNVSFPATYSIKFKTNSTNNQIIFGDTTTGAALGLYDSNSKFILSIGTDTVMASTGGITLNTFYTVDIVYQSLSEFTVYLNGIALTNLTDVNNWRWGNTNSYLGQRSAFDIYGTVSFSGVIERFMIYDDALTESEILYNLSITNLEVSGDGIIEDNLKLYYNFNSTIKTLYQNASVGAEIDDSNILAFYVWIPRFKYRVWNISRQAGDESTYGYPAYSKGIDIKWENSIESTGNVTCSYDVTTEESETSLSDECVYNETDTITTESVNSNYTDAWYTHPAFNFGGEPKTGIWVGKFETGGTAESPVILPNVISLRSQSVSTQFTTSKVFQTYGLSSDVDAHMLTNLEWGAVTYLTHSIYGLCDGTSCLGVYNNNSSLYYTGRSAGVIASNSTYSNYGSYDYRGFLVNSDSGLITNTKEEKKLASTTGNITGVYDMSGGTYEYVMGNMVDSTTVFNPGSSGTSWNGSTTLDSKYYNSYSYGGADYYLQIAFNRARLGDATAEVLGITTDGSNANGWKPGSGITGSGSAFITNGYPWFFRGGNYYVTEYSSLFSFSNNAGASNDLYTFRSSLS